MCPRFCVVFSCVQAQALRWADPPSEEYYLLPNIYIIFRK